MAPADRLGILPWVTMGAGAAAGWAAGAAGVPDPPIGHPGRLTDWWSSVGPVLGSFGFLRAALFGLAVAGAAAGTAGAARRAGWALARGGWDRVGGWRGWCRLLVGLSVSGGTLAGCGLDRPGPAASAGSVAAPSAPSTTRGRAEPPPAPVLLGPPAPIPAPLGPPRPARRAAASAGAPATATHGSGRVAAARASARAAPSTWVVRPGDNLWSIAESALAAAGLSPTPGEIVPYWRRLIDANRSRLARPDDPDLLFTGQVLVLPPHSPGPS